MRYIRLSPSQIINLETVTHIEIYETDAASYTTVHFVSGGNYRLTEEEAEVLSAGIGKFVDDSSNDGSKGA